ncbi:MAG: hypothetical protein SFU91_14215 [Chloroherpetonaceae bacterium]|nr:hypothetical protein [Chloroherpetonaceae bacterium]
MISFYFSRCNNVLLASRHFLALLILSISLSVGASNGFSQERERPTSEQRKARAEQRENRERPGAQDRLENRAQQQDRFTLMVRKFQAEKMSERLKLSAEQRERFMERYSKYQDEFTDNFKRLQGAMKDLEQLQMGNGSEKEIDAKTREVLELRNASTEILPKYLSNFREMLSARQAAELVIFERDFLRDITKVIRAARREQMKENGGLPEAPERENE